MAQRWDEEAEIVVVGGGLAAHCAALQAQEEGARVLMMEKEAQVGGSTVLSGGSFAFAGTDLQKKNGIDDDGEKLFEDLRRVGEYGNDEAVVRTYVDGQLDTYHWLARHGVVFERIFLAAGQSVPRAHSHDPKLAIEILSQRAAQSQRIETRVSSPVRRLIRQGVDGPVLGVVVEQGGRERAIRAQRGVIAASKRATGV